MWAVVNDTDYVVCVSHHRHDATKEVEWEFAPEKGWRWLRDNLHWRCVRVLVTELESGRPALPSGEEE
jgi:hypothetical protein